MGETGCDIWEKRASLVLLFAFGEDRLEELGGALAVRVGVEEGAAGMGCEEAEVLEQHLVVWLAQPLRALLLQEGVGRARELREEAAVAHVEAERLCEEVAILTLDRLTHRRSHRLHRRQLRARHPEQRRRGPLGGHRDEGLRGAARE